MGKQALRAAKNTKKAIAAAARGPPESFPFARPPSLPAPPPPPPPPLQTARHHQRLQRQPPPPPLPPPPPPIINESAAVGVDEYEEEEKEDFSGGVVIPFGGQNVPPGGVYEEDELGNVMYKFDDADRGESVRYFQRRLGDNERDEGMSVVRHSGNGDYQHQYYSRVKCGRPQSADMFWSSLPSLFNRMITGGGGAPPPPPLMIDDK